MKLFLLIITLLTSEILLADTQIFESQENNKSFTAKVKIIRQNHGETEVAFDGAGNTGFYTLPESDRKGELEQILTKSKSPKGPQVTVTTSDDREIQDVSISEKSKDK